ncbi:MAG TPA: glycosyl transferase, partial [Firmicutes bacterium]|nr:glycosyl transferase [Bacillota bacterium]
MKLISFVVPSYNASKYLDKVIPSLLVGGDEVEIIIVNDGSKDNTLEIAKNYEKENSNVIVIDKENGGHGSTINEAIKVANGLYFKCVDADDWLDKDALLSLLERIKADIENKKSP